MKTLRALALTLPLLVVPAIAFGQGADVRPIGSSEILLDRIAAIVGKKVITMTELYQAINEERARREIDPKAAKLSSDTVMLKRQFLDDMIDQELLLQKADALKLTVPDEELAPTIQRQYDEARGSYKSDADFQAALKEAGYGSVADWRKYLLDGERRHELQKKVIDTLTALGKMPKISVSEKDIQATYDSMAAHTKPPGPTITFRQIIINPQPSDTADARARKLADSLLTLLKGGASFDTLARKFSNDSTNKDQGGVLPPFRRDAMVAAFSVAAFSTPVGQLSPLVRTRYGYHIIRVDRVKPGEVTARHILITPVRNAGDVDRVRKLADSIAVALRAGANYDSIAAKYHDSDGGEDRLLPNLIIDSLPSIYRNAMEGLKPTEVSKPFDIPNPSGGVPKVGVVQIMSINETGMPTLGEKREQIRDNLQRAASWRHLLDNLRRETYVSIRL